MNITSVLSIGSGLTYPRGIFVTINNDIYVDNAGWNHLVEKWTVNGTSGTAVMRVSGSCISLFVDISGTLYCSLDSIPLVMKSTLTAGMNASITIAAGNGTAGSSPNLLSAPNGIFVDTNFSLYVADCYNNRVQRFAANQLDGTTVVGSSASGTIDLVNPTAVTLDADEYFFVVDFNNHRVVGQGSKGFRCIVGCLGASGSDAFHLHNPRSMAFDSDGNLFVLDTGNGRIQRFELVNDTCSKFRLSQR